MADSANNDPRWVLLLLLFPLALGLGIFLPNRAQKPTRKKLIRKTPVRARIAVNPTPRKPSGVRIIKMFPVDGRRQVPPPRPAKRTVKPRPTKRAHKHSAKSLFYPIPMKQDFKKIDQFYDVLFLKARKFAIKEQEKAFVNAVFATRYAEANKVVNPKLSQTMLFQSLRYFRINGLIKYRLLCYKLLGQFERALQNYMNRKGPLLSVPKKGHALERTATILTNLAGDYSDLFRRIGVKENQKSLTPQQKLWLRTFYAARWMHMLRGQLPLSAALQPQVFTQFLEARVLFAGVENARYRALGELFKRNQKYPYARVMGWLSIQTNRRKEARKFLKKALTLNPKDTYVKGLLDKL